MFYGGTVVCVPVCFFSLPLIFTSVAARIYHFLAAATKIFILSLALALSLLSSDIGIVIFAEWIPFLLENAS